MYFILTLLFLFPIIRVDPQPAWQNFLVLSSQAAEIEALLQQKGLFYLSWRNVKVEVSDLSELETVLIKDLKTRLDPLDPRWDPFLKSLPSLFLHHAGWNEFHRVWYHASDKSQVISLLEHDPDQLDASLAKGLSFITWLFFLFLIGNWKTCSLKQKILWSLGSAVFLLLPLPYFFWGGLLLSTRHLGFLLSERASTIVMQESPLKIKAMPLGSFAFLLGFLMLLLLTKRISLQETLLGILGACLSGGILLLFYRWRLKTLRKLEHKLFLPLPLQESRQIAKLKALLSKKTNVAIGIGGTLAILLNLSFLDQKPFLQKHKESPPLLPVETYLQHRWFQEGLPFGITWDDYHDGATRTLPFFSKKDGKIIETHQILVISNHKWRTETWNSLPETHVAKLLGQPTR